MVGKSKKDWLQRKLGGFLQQYQRKSQRGQEPNDRGYDRRVEKKLKQMRPEDLDAILNSEDELPQSPKPKKKDEQSK